MRVWRKDLRACAGHDDGSIHRLWIEGCDTREIAKRLFVHESVVANRLPGILERARQDQEWNFDYLHEGVREECQLSKETGR